MCKGRGRMEEMIHRSFCTRNCSMYVKLLCARSGSVGAENATGPMCRSRPSS